MKKQVILFLKYFLSIQDGTDEELKNSKIKELTFNPKFHKELIKQQYLKTNDTTFRGYPFTIECEEGADYWGMILDEK